MNLLVTANHAPFIEGGAEAHLAGLVAALRAHGHRVETLRLPFTFEPPAAIERLMAFAAGLDLTAPNGQRIHRLISLQFPGYGITHPHHIVWLMHQHRAVYELYPSNPSPELERLRTAIHAYDTTALARVHARFANSRRVAQRLRHYNGLDAEPLYHPPPAAEAFYTAPAEPYLYAPSRLERLKRQDLLIEAMRHVRAPLALLLSGEGGQAHAYRQLIERHGLQHRVRLLGRVDERLKRTLYAHALAVAFAPFDEDLGYVTLEAMLAAKPLLTCTDSGGPLEFVLPGETGFVCSPEPQLLAERIDWLYAHRPQAAAMGRAGRARWETLGITWTRVIDRLLTA